MENQNNTTNPELDKLSQDPAALEEALNEGIGAVKGNETDQKEEAKSETKPEDVERKKKDTAERFEKILSDRRIARQEAEAAEAEKNKLAEELASLRQEIDTLKKVSGSDDDTEHKEPQDNEDISKLIEKKVNEILSVKEREILAEKSTAEEIKATSEREEFSGMKGREDDVASIMKKHPSLSAAAAYYTLVGMEKSHDVESNASKMGVGSRSNSDLLRDKRPEEMTTKELGNELANLAKEGKLKF